MAPTSEVLADMADLRSQLREQGSPYSELFKLRPARVLLDIAFDWTLMVGAVAAVVWLDVMLAPLSVLVLANRQRALGTGQHPARRGSPKHFSRQRSERFCSPWAGGAVAVRKPIPIPGDAFPTPPGVGPHARRSRPDSGSGSSAIFVDGQLHKVPAFVDQLARVTGRPSVRPEGQLEEQSLHHGMVGEPRRCAGPVGWRRFCFGFCIAVVDLAGNAVSLHHHISRDVRSLRTATGRGVWLHP